MTFRILQSCPQAVPVWLCFLATGVATPSVFADDVQFTRDIRPLLSNSCYACHGPDRETQENDLRLDVRENAIESAIVPGQAADSELLHRISSDDPDLMMPPPGSNRQKLDTDEVALIQRWIDAGATYEGHWAYQPVSQPVPPAIDGRWGQTSIDSFIVDANRNRQVEQSSSADRRVLARRLSFDLLGLPPTPEQVEAFVNDPSKDAYASFVDQLLASRHYGERLAVLWLDLVRYADTVGYHGDQHREIDAYRDYVIDAFNSNMPFDQFTIEQLAGDLLPDPTQDQRIASGFNRLLQTTQEGGAQPAEYRAIYDADRVRNVSTVWLGSTLGCAQCHDHKFDPFTSRDFYRFAAFFADVEEVAVGVQQPNLQLPTAAQQEQLETLTAQIQRMKQQSAECAPDDANAQTSSSQEQQPQSDELKQLEKERERLEAAIRKTLVTNTIKPRTMRVLPRGNWLDQSGEVVSPAVPELFGELEFEGERGTRMDLARWLVSDRNPLTARVFVNHLWRVMFGYGLVRTPDDFGSQGQYPTHPELLDYMATEFRQSSWDVKHMLRLIANSETYRQSSARRYPERDPFNTWYTSQNQFRIDAEMVRDNALFVSGLLAADVGGRSVKPYQPGGYWRELNFPKRKYQADQGANQYRRGVYTYWCRTFLHPSLAAFDAPSREECTAQRPRSNTPLQALVLLNDPTYVESAVALAKRCLNEVSESSDEDTLSRMFALVLTREPTSDELRVLIDLAEQQIEHYRRNPDEANDLLASDKSARYERLEFEPAELAGWTSVARVLLNLHETVTRK